MADARRRDRARTARRSAHVIGDALPRTARAAFDQQFDEIERRADRMTGMSPRRGNTPGCQTIIANPMQLEAAAVDPSMPPSPGSAASAADHARRGDHGCGRRQTFSHVTCGSRLSHRTQARSRRFEPGRPSRRAGRECKRSPTGELLGSEVVRQNSGFSG
jgi:hypothetical protein